jgi:hypothetical protein
MKLPRQSFPKQSFPKQPFPRQQQGLSFFGWLLMVLVFGSVITMGMKLLPLYLDHNTISNVLDGMAEEKGLAGKRQYELEDMLKKRFKVNNVRDFNHKENLVIKRDKSGVAVIIDYEVRVPLFHNVDLIASFDKSVVLKD